MVKLDIDIEQLAEEFLGDARLLGIMSPLKYYQFAWNINQCTGFKFRINIHLEIPLKKNGRNYFFPVSEYVIPGLAQVHYIYNNKYEGKYLLQELKHLDYLWLIKDAEIRDEDILDLSTRIRPIPGVQLVSEIFHKEIKNRQNLIL